MSRRVYFRVVAFDGESPEVMLSEREMDGKPQEFVMDGKRYVVRCTIEEKE